VEADSGNGYAPGWGMLLMMMMMNHSIDVYCLKHLRRSTVRGSRTYPVRRTLCKFSVNIMYEKLITVRIKYRIVLLLSCHNQISRLHKFPDRSPTLGIFPDLSRIPDISGFPEIPENW